MQDTGGDYIISIDFTLQDNPKNNGPQNFFVIEVVTGLNVLTPLGGIVGRT